MIAGYHLIWTAYGWWLPNDPRGSSSHEIRVERIAELGELHRGRKLVQPPSRVVREFYEQAQQVLHHLLLTLDEQDFPLIAGSFGKVIREHGYTCYECAIMPDHVHMLIRKHRDWAETMIDFFQEASAKALRETGRRPPEHPVWGGPGWKVYLNTRADMERVVQYIRQNPVKIGRPVQEWDFVQKYDGWLPRQARRR
jgi:REP element-mobilizing transposase RayT